MKVVVYCVSVAGFMVSWNGFVMLNDASNRMTMDKADALAEVDVMVAAEGDRTLVCTVDNRSYCAEHIVSLLGRNGISAGAGGSHVTSIFVPEKYERIALNLIEKDRRRFPHIYTYDPKLPGRLGVAVSFCIKGDRCKAIVDSAYKVDKRLGQAVAFAAEQLELTDSTDLIEVFRITVDKLEYVASSGILKEAWYCRLNVVLDTKEHKVSFGQFAQGEEWQQVLYSSVSIGVTLGLGDTMR